MSPGPDWSPLALFGPFLAKDQRDALSRIEDLFEAAEPGDLTTRPPDDDGPREKEETA
jgi:hypothetical protein